MPEGVTIRPETAADAAAVGAVLTAAFGGEDEARLVEALRAADGLAASLVATMGGAVVGHAALSAVTIDGRTGPWLGLAPVAVAPPSQGRGIGRALVRRTIDAAAARNAAVVFVLGRASYYAALGFEEAAPGGWRCLYPAPASAFRVRRLAAEAMPPSGTVRYHQAFDAL